MILTRTKIALAISEKRVLAVTGKIFISVIVEDVKWTVYEQNISNYISYVQLEPQTSGFSV